MNEYTARIAYTLNTELTAPLMPATFVPYPDHILWPIETDTLSLLEFLQLKECNLQSLVGEKNSSLGKLMTPDLTLIYSHKIIIGLEQCLKRMENMDDSGTNRLRYQGYLNKKKQQKKKIFFNATFGSIEFKHLFSRPSPPFNTTQMLINVEKDYSSVLEILSEIAYMGLYFGQAQASIVDYQKAQNALIAFNTYGEISALIHYFSSTLGSVTSLLNTQLDRRPLCFNQAPSQKAKVLNNIFLKYYARDLQEKLSKLYNISDLLHNHLYQLANHPNTHIPHPFKEYYDHAIHIQHPHSQWQQFKAHISAHSQAWQRLFKQCGLLPTQPFNDPRI